MEWLTSNASAWPLVIISAIAVYITVTLCLRLVGLRSFSKMSSTDFVTTVAIGSLMAAIITAPSPSMIIGAIALATVFALKWGVATLRRTIPSLTNLLDNEAIYIMQGSTIHHAALAKANMTQDELHAKLREANVWSFEQVICVVLETTGDVSVLHQSIENPKRSNAIFQDVT